jgi:hypothetical protein
MTRQERREAVKGSVTLIVLFILGSIVDTLDGLALNIAAGIAVAFIALGVAAYKRSNK